MSFVSELSRADLPELEPIFQAAERALGFLPNALLIMARRPRLLRAFGGIMMELHGPGPLATDLKWLVAMAASQGAGCSYCAAHCAIEIDVHAGGATRAAALYDFESSALFSDAERVVIRYATAAGATPSQVTEAHVTDLRRFYDDEAIIDITGIISIMGFLNRWNAALGVTLEDRPRTMAQAHLADKGWALGVHG